MVGPIRRAISTAAKKAVRAAKIATKRQLSSKRLEKIKRMTPRDSSVGRGGALYKRFGSGQDPSVMTRRSIFVYNDEGNLVTKHGTVKGGTIEYNPPGRFIGRRRKKN